MSVTVVTSNPPAAPNAAGPSASPDPAIVPQTPLVNETKVAASGRLTAIEIRNYRAYRGTFRLELPKSENLLVYGENGAGKSSLFETLRTFMEAPDLRVRYASSLSTHGTRPIRITDHQHRFTDKDPSVILEFGSQKFEWASAKNDTASEFIRRLNQAKGFLDYKALLEVHYLRADEKQEINLFPLLMRSLLPHYTYSPPTGTSLTFPKGLDQLQIEAKKSWSPGWRRKQKLEDLQTSLNAYNKALEKAVDDLGARASTMLENFGDDFRVSFKYEKAEYKTWPKRIEAPKILAVLAFRRLQFSDYHNFFNEARLSAMAICLFLAALKESPATGLRLLVLDDILIGLDMSNRVKVINVVRDQFSDWQIIILTYSKAWFERLKDHFKAPGWLAPWLSVVLWEDWHDADASPFIVASGSGDLLEIAGNHLVRKDYKAAAVYARSAFEALCHHACAKAALFVLHVDSPKDRKVEHYWTVLKARISEIVDDSRRAKALALSAALEQAREFVLNRNAHFDVEEEDTLSGEVGAALETVKGLKHFVEAQPWENENFHSGRPVPALEQMRANLFTARELAAKHATRQCQNALKAAFASFWLEYGSKLGVRLPIGAELTAAAIWKAAKHEKLLPVGVEAKLDASKPFLFGCVKGDKFDPLKFEEAAKLLEELSSSPIITPPTQHASAASAPNAPA